MKELQNCDQLIKYMTKLATSNRCICSKDVLFQGDLLTIGGYECSINTGSWLICDRVTPNLVWIVGIPYGNRFSLGVFYKQLEVDEMIGIDLPLYVREELIATLRGEW